MTLDELRVEIDGIDKQIIRLFMQRMETVENVAHVKMEKGLPILCPDREKTIITRNLAQVRSDDYFYALSFYQNLLELSRYRQRELLHEGRAAGPVSELLSHSRRPVGSPRVCVQGVEASYAMAAAKKMYADADITYVHKWEDIFYSLAEGSCDYGVLPVENSRAGSVGEVFDLLIKYRCYIVNAISLPVDHYLLGVRGAKISEIRRVFSHPHAFPQCSAFLQKYPRFELVPYTNTATAAEHVAREGRPENAAIASRDCAALYGLDVLAKSIQTSRSNCTRFIALSRSPEVAPNANKVSLFFTLPHVTGSLYHTLGRFAFNSLNICKIESRPIPDRNFEYYFYLDFTGSVRATPTLELLDTLSEELPGFNFLGNYFEPAEPVG